AAIQQQDLFNEVVGPDSLQADLNERTLRSARGVLSGITLLGSFSELDRTWLWGWANPGFGPDAPAVVPTGAIRAARDQRVHRGEPRPERVRAAGPGRGRARDHGRY